VITSEEDAPLSVTHIVVEIGDLSQKDPPRATRDERQLTKTTRRKEHLPTPVETRRQTTSSFPSYLRKGLQRLGKGRNRSVEPWNEETKLEASRRRAFPVPPLAKEEREKKMGLKDQTS
jgi:hypothetical protein